MARPTALDDLDITDAQRRTLLEIASWDPVGRVLQQTYVRDRKPQQRTLDALREHDLLDEQGNLTGEARRILTNTDGV